MAAFVIWIFCMNNSKVFAETWGQKIFHSCIRKKRLLRVSVRQKERKKNPWLVGVRSCERAMKGRCTFEILKHTQSQKYAQRRGIHVHVFQDSHTHPVAGRPSVWCCGPTFPCVYKTYKSSYLADLRGPHLSSGCEKVTFATFAFVRTAERGGSRGCKSETKGER